MFPAGMAFVYLAVAIRAVQSVGNAAIIITTFTYTNLQFPRSTGIIFVSLRPYRETRLDVSSSL